MTAVWYIVNDHWYCDHVGEDYDFTAADMIGMWKSIGVNVMRYW